MIPTHHTIRLRPLMIFLAGMLFFIQSWGQTYPDPEFKNEVYALNKEASSLTRLEKNLAKQETKTKLGGFGGMEYGYAIEGKKSPVRLPAGSHSFVFAKASTSGSSQATEGFDLSAGMGMDLSNMISLYKVSADKANRKINLMQNSGAFGNKNKSSDKYSFSVRQVKDGYWELLVDKPLSAGEYSFVIMGYNADATHTLYSFGID